MPKADFISDLFKKIIEVYQEEIVLRIESNKVPEYEDSHNKSKNIIKGENPDSDINNKAKNYFNYNYLAEIDSFQKFINSLHLESHKRFLESIESICDYIKNLENKKLCSAFYKDLTYYIDYKTKTNKFREITERLKSLHFFFLFSIILKEYFLLEIKKKY